MFRPAGAGPLKVITGNRLDNGLVVFLDPAGGWALRLADARILETPEAVAEATQFAGAQHDARVVVEPYLIDVDLSEAGVPVPTRLRERIRADGPTVDYGAAERERLTGAGRTGLAAAE